MTLYTILVGAKSRVRPTNLFCSATVAYSFSAEGMHSSQHIRPRASLPTRQLASPRTLYGMSFVGVSVSSFRFSYLPVLKDVPCRAVHRCERRKGHLDLGGSTIVRSVR